VDSIGDAGIVGFHFVAECGVNLCNLQENIWRGNRKTREMSRKTNIRPITDESRIYIAENQIL